jgi:hypothetical protein
MHVVIFILTSVSAVIFWEPSFLLSGGFLDINLLWWLRSWREEWEGQIYDDMMSYDIRHDITFLLSLYTCNNSCCHNCTTMLNLTIKISVLHP